MKLNNPAEFGQKIIDQFVNEGWGSLGKRDLELLIFALLEKDGVLSRQNSNYTLARQLRITELKLAVLRRDGTARWRPLLGEQPEAVLKRVINEALQTKKLEFTLKSLSDLKLKEGLIPLLVDHPDDRAELEHAIKQIGAIPLYERNREVVLVHYKVLFALIENLGLNEHNLKALQKNLKKIMDGQLSLKKYLMTPVNEITMEGTRAALNDAGAIVTVGGFKELLPALLKIIIPSISEAQ